MKKILHHIRKQPEETRKHILHLLTIIFGIILLSLWVYSLGSNLSNEDTQNRIKQDIKPFSILKDTLPNIW